MKSGDSRSDSSITSDENDIVDMRRSARTPLGQKSKANVNGRSASNLKPKKAFDGAISLVKIDNGD